MSSVSVLQSSLNRCEELVIDLSGGQLNSLLENLKADGYQFLTELSVIRQLRHCLVDDRAREW